jgi:hypothetical protein
MICKFLLLIIWSSGFGFVVNFFLPKCHLFKSLHTTGTQYIDMNAMRVCRLDFRAQKRVKICSVVLQPSSH